MKPALLLIDVQEDFLTSPGLQPHRGALVDEIATVLSEFRQHCWPVVHIWTTICSDEDRMPHWLAQHIDRCRHGSDGHQTPERLTPRPGELVMHKHWFSAFTNPQLEEELGRLACDELYLCGLLLRACVRTTALDAYQRGWPVRILQQAVADDDPLHRDLTRRYLSARGIGFVASPKGANPMGQRIAQAPLEIGQGPGETPVVSAHDGTTELFAVANAEATQIDEAVRATTHWWRHERLAPEAVCAHVNQVLTESCEELAQLIATDVGKPIRLARQELAFARALAQSSAEHFERWCPSQEGTGWTARACSHGAVAVITPFNNPLAIAVGKIVPALLYGNAVVWKPALSGARVAETFSQRLVEAGLPEDCLRLTHGGNMTAETLLRHPEIRAATLTGGGPAGTSGLLLSASRHIPYQAELGGNNGAIVWHDADLAQAAELVAHAAFAYAGQRCTACRRVIVEERVLPSFSERLMAAFHQLPWGDPLDPLTVIGPVISAQAHLRLRSLLARTRAAGMRCVERDDAIKQTNGFYTRPTIVYANHEQAEIVTEESFGPILVVQTATTWEQALTLGQDRYGLVSSLFSESAERKASFLQRARAGILRVNTDPAGAAAGAPFGGWGEAAYGLPEHGIADPQFFTRWQTVYHQPNDGSFG